MRLGEKGKIAFPSLLFPFLPFSFPSFSLPSFFLPFPFFRFALLPFFFLSSFPFPSLFLSLPFPFLLPFNIFSLSPPFFFLFSFYPFLLASSLPIDFQDSRLASNPLKARVGLRSKEKRRAKQVKVCTGEVQQLNHRTSPTVTFGPAWQRQIWA